MGNKFKPATQPSQKNPLGRNTVEIKSKVEKKFYYIIGEGFTETQYFQNIGDMCKDNGYPADLTVEIKALSDRDKSSPYELYGLVMDRIADYANSVIRIETIAKDLETWALESNILLKNEYNNNLQQCFLDAFEYNGISEPIEIDDFIKNKRKYEDLIYHIFEQGIIKSICNNKFVKLNFHDLKNYYLSTFIRKIIENHGLEKKIDHYCIVYDRDQIGKSNYSNLLKEIELFNNLLKNNKIKTIITNPCFEFWLLMHFDEAMTKFNETEMLENPKNYVSDVVDEKIRYSHHMIEQYIKGYRKNEIQFAKYLGPHIETAIRNEKKFCEDTKKLENTIGSTVGRLIEEFMHPELADSRPTTPSGKIKFQLF